MPIAASLDEVQLLCVPYVEEGGNAAALAVNTDTEGCTEMTEEAVEAEYLPLVCPDPEVTDQNSPGFVVRHPAATDRLVPTAQRPVLRCSTSLHVGCMSAAYK